LPAILLYLCHRTTLSYCHCIAMHSSAPYCSVYSSTVEYSCLGQTNAYEKCEISRYTTYSEESHITLHDEQRRATYHVTRRTGKSHISRYTTYSDEPHITLHDVQRRATYHVTRRTAKNHISRYTAYSEEPHITLHDGQRRATYRKPFVSASLR
jgi:hypothetical protein